MSSINKLTEKIVNHLNSFDLAISATFNLYQHSTSGNVDEIEYWSNNRQRMINILQSQQSDIEELLGTIPQEFLTADFIDTLKSWVHDVTVGTGRIAEIDQDIVEALNNEKDKTTQEIAQNFQSKDKLKGYNLNKVR